MAIVTTSSRGQVVIPRDVRRRLNITAGKKLLVKVVDDRIIMEPLPDDPIDAFYGVFRGKDSLTEALLEDRRKEASREEAESAR